MAQAAPPVNAVLDARQSANEPGHLLQPRQQELLSWSGFYPTGWTNHVPLTSGINANDPAGLNAGSAVYRTSTNGGASYTAWTNSGLSTTGSGNTVSLQVAGLTFPDSQSGNRIQFSIETVAGATYISEGYAIAVDTTAPLPPSNLRNFPDTWTNVNSFSETWTNPSDLSGIAGAYYRLNTPPAYATDGTFVTTNFVNNIEVPGEGVHSILIWLVDGAGNIDHNEYRADLGAFRYDATRPVVGVTREGSLGQNGWYTSTVSVAFAPIDTLSGIATWSWRLDAMAPSQAISTTISANGRHTVEVAASDNAGNVAPPVTYSVNLDQERPTLAHSVSISPSVSGWYTAPLTVRFTLSDTVSGPAGVRWQLDSQPYTSGSQVLVQQDGRHTLRAYGQDLAGNRSTQLTLNLPIDSRPPSTTLSLAPPVAPSGYYTSSVSGQFTATDVPPGLPAGSGSGVLVTWMSINAGGWQPARALLFAIDGAYRVDYFSIDRAGNTEITRTQTIMLDATPPGAPTAVTITPSSWSGTNMFSLSWQNPSDASGIAGAYLFLGQGPPPPGAGTFYPGATQISNLSAPSEGSWPVWMWLVDGAGNRGAPVQVGWLRFDASPPQVEATVSGTAGNAGWFVSPIEVVLSNVDDGSGPALLRYRLNGDPWQQDTAAQVAVPIGTPGKHVLEYLGQNVAGLTSGPFLQTLRVDPDAPTAPLVLAVEPSGWTPTNQFTVTWRNPLDTSGIAVAHVDFEPPASPQDGQPLPASSQAAQIEAPAEGSHDLYMWLEDVAGNVDVSQAAALGDALRYDATAPVTTLRFLPAAGASGWFRSPVVINLDAVDAHAGVASTTWQLDSQVPVTGTQLSVQDDGIHTLVVQSTDRAGNVEQPVETAIKIDSQAPAARLYSLNAYNPTPDVSVGWGADDGPQGSGVAHYDVQVKVGTDGSWQPWLTDTTLTQSTYQGERGQVLAFRMRASDVADNTSAWNSAGGQNTVVVDPVDNGFFVTQNWEGWTTRDELGLTMIQETSLMPGSVIPAGRLGSTTWQACAAPGNLPTLQCEDDWSGISQTITVPPLSQVLKPTLEVWYRVQTYDQMTTTASVWGNLCPSLGSPPYLVDSFDITAQAAGSAQPTVLHRAGNTQPQFPLPIEFRDMGWRLVSLDMTPFAGQTITLRLSSHNRLDSRFNTWTDVYGIRVRGTQQKMFLPLAPQKGQAPQPPAVCWPDAPANTADGADFSALPAEDQEGSLR